KDWKSCSQVVQNRSDWVVRQWQEETHCFWASLFSAILTAFSVESCTLLQPDQGDEMLAALMTISAPL
ncbi:hypothetical protein BD414DRAFT_382872, partial [Trametes punicea]